MIRNYVMRDVKVKRAWKRGAPSGSTVSVTDQEYSRLKKLGMISDIEQETKPVIEEKPEEKPEENPEDLVKKVKERGRPRKSNDG